MAKQDIDPAELNFEAAMMELESIIGQIDAGEIGLEDAMKAHRRGQALTARCRQILDAVTKELERLPEEADAD